MEAEGDLNKLTEADEDRAVGIRCGIYGSCLKSTCALGFFKIFARKAPLV